MLLKEFEDNFDSKRLVFIMVYYSFDLQILCTKWTMGALCRHPFIQRSDSQVFPIYITHHGEFVFISVVLFISPFPPQEIMYPKRRSATIIFFSTS